MLAECKDRPLAFIDEPSTVPPFAVTNPEIEILDEMSAKLTAAFSGPAGSKVIGRAWIGDEDGTMVDGMTEVIAAGTRAEILLTIPKSKVQNGNLTAYMRVEWPKFQTKHVVSCLLLEGEIVHPPKGKEC